MSLADFQYSFKHQQRISQLADALNMHIPNTALGQAMQMITFNTKNADQKANNYAQPALGAKPVLMFHQTPQVPAWKPTPRPVQTGNVLQTPKYYPRQTPVVQKALSTPQKNSPLSVSQLNPTSLVF